MILSDSVTFKYRSQVISMNLKKNRSGTRSSNVSSSSSSNQNFLVKYVCTSCIIWTCVRWTYEHSKMEVCVKLIELISLAGFGLQLRNALFRHASKKNQKRWALILKDWGQKFLLWRYRTGVLIFGLRDPKMMRELNLRMLLTNWWNIFYISAKGVKWLAKASKKNNLMGFPLMFCSPGYLFLARDHVDILSKIHCQPWPSFGDLFCSLFLPFYWSHGLSPIFPVI